MAIHSSISILASVGRGGSNRKPDVTALQERLNALMGNSRTRLAVDGLCGPRTIAMISDFQRHVVGFRRPDGLVERSGRTIRALDEPGSAMVWQRMGIAPPHTLPSPPRSLLRGERLIEQESEALGLGVAWEEMRRAVVDGAVPPMKKFLGSVGRAEDARTIIEAWHQLRSAGLGINDTAFFIKELSNLRHADHDGYKRTVKALEELASPTSKLGRVFKKFAGTASGAGHLVTMVEVADRMSDGDYLFGLAELYKHAMSRVFPWAAMIEGVQALVDAFAPQSWKRNELFQLIRACDPIGLGAVGVDAMATFVLGTVHLVQTGEIDMARLSRLTRRMKSGPGHWFAERGEEMGDALWEMSSWRSQDWRFAIEQVPGWIESWFESEREPPARPAAPPRARGAEIRRPHQF